MRDFKVYPNKIPAQLVDTVLDNHERFKQGKLSVFRAQGETEFEYPRLDAHNNQLNSIHNPHLLGFSSSFRNSIRDVIFHENISNCLKDFCDNDDFIHYQSMFFDKSTATKLHQDTWYLDTEPKGNLVGVWIALEDITAVSGPFCLYTKTDIRLMDTDEFDWNNIENDESFAKNYPSSKLFKFHAKKGDILIWNSMVLHGALKPTSETATRKSLTSHFYPSSMHIQDVPIKRFLSIYNHDAPRKTPNKHIALAATMNPVMYNSLCLTLNKLGGFKNLITRDNTVDKSVSKIRRIDS